MYEFVNKLKEIKGAILRLRIFETLLDALLIFLFFCLIFLPLGIRVAYAFIPSFIYILFRASRSVNTLKLIEEKYPSFRERLDTAYDNREKKGIVVKDLSDGISEEMESVRYSSFISGRRVVGKVLLCALLSIFVLLLPFSNIKLEIPYIPEKPFGVIEKPGAEKEGVAETVAGAGAATAEEDMFGEPSIAKIEGEKLSLELYPGAGEIKLRDVKERKFSEVQPLAATALPVEAFSENVPQEYEEIIRAYFEKLTEESK